MAKGKEFTAEEKEILSAALRSLHQIHLLSTDQAGDFVQCGEKDFLYEDDFEKRRLYVYALETLCEKGLVKYVRGQLYKLTAKGFKEAEKL